MKKPLYLLASLALLLAACGGEATSSPSESSSEEASTSVPTVTVSSSSSEELTPRETFLKARKATVDLKGYSYKEVLEATTDTSLPEGYDPTGTREGNVVYSSTSAVKQVASYENSGALFFDGKRYEIVEGDELHVERQTGEGLENTNVAVRLAVPLRVRDHVGLPGPKGTPRIEDGDGEGGGRRTRPRGAHTSTGTGPRPTRTGKDRPLLGLRSSLDERAFSGMRGTDLTELLREQVRTHL